ncbi:hypothetical protein GCM10011519_10400 [Marmoricola endophyticus]|uniref:Uncharacterized protein n=1 Tax=Marmoricola endophyticus TaxID=2040280 RepID=A0A917F045_9ACTN|nr:hypothetical protein [Marmoricola endophyticus]GGF38717.1 hypothetical protein GCM10011519_10400 [Marmoricola endophyticus]
MSTTQSTATHHDADRTGDPAALDRLIRLMLVNLGLGLLVAALTLLLHGAIVDHQAAHSTRSRAALSTDLWSRPGPAVAVAILYPLFIRRLRQRSQRGWRRTVIVAVAQLLSLGWFAIGAHYPVWLSALMGLQAVVVLAVLRAATRPAVRRLFAFPAPTAASRTAHRAAWLLVVLAPLVAELSWGSTRASQIAGLTLYWPAYAGGALLVREVVRRTGGGWASILALGVGYGLLEEGLALQSLTSPSIFPDMAALTPRPWGIDVGYAVMVLTYHAVISIAVPIRLAELVVPSAAHRPWLARPTLVVTGVVAVLGLGLLRLIPLSADPDYLLPWPAYPVLAVLVVLLVGLALVAPRPAARTTGALPSPGVVGGLAGLAALVFLGLLMPLPGVHHAAWTPSGDASWVAVVASLVVLAGAAVLGRRWTARTGWTDLHATAAVAGVLVAHTVIGWLSLVHTALDRTALGVVGLVEVVLLALLIRRVGGAADRGSPPAR